MIVSYPGTIYRTGGREFTTASDAYEHAIRASAMRLVGAFVTLPNYLSYHKAIVDAIMADPDKISTLLRAVADEISAIRTSADLMS